MASYTFPVPRLCDLVMVVCQTMAWQRLGLNCLPNTTFQQQQQQNHEHLHILNKNIKTRYNLLRYLRLHKYILDINSLLCLSLTCTNYSMDMLPKGKKDDVASRAARTLWFMSQSWEFQLPGVLMYTQSRKWFLLQKSSSLKNKTKYEFYYPCWWNAKLRGEEWLAQVNTVR